MIVVMGAHGYVGSALSYRKKVPLMVPNKPVKALFSL
jgi:hypothetical protein